MLAHTHALTRRLCSSLSDCAAFVDVQDIFEHRHFDKDAIRLLLTNQMTQMVVTTSPENAPQLWTDAGWASSEDQGSSTLGTRDTF